jgi:hypothetical protein
MMNRILFAVTVVISTLLYGCEAILGGGYSVAEGSADVRANSDDGGHFGQNYEAGAEAGRAEAASEDEGVVETDAGMVDTGAVEADSGTVSGDSGAAEGGADTGSPDVSDACMPVTHSDGLGQTWTDCVPLGTYNEAQAMKACEAWTVATDASVGSCVVNSCSGEMFVENEVAGRIWSYAGPYTELVTQYGMGCPYGSGLPWN